MQGRTFLLGLATGGALVAVAAFVLRSAGAGSPAFAQLRDAPGEPSQDGATTAEDPISLRQEIARLRAELELARRGTGRTPVHAGSGQQGNVGSEEIDAPSAEVVAVPADRITEELLAELDDLLRSGALHDKFRSSPEELANFLLQAWTEAGQPERALQILQRFDLDNELGGWGSWIGQMLRQKGNSEHATEAYLMAMRSSPTDWDALSQLAELAPELALREHQQLIAAAGLEQDPDARAQHALLLLSAGRSEDALAAIDAILGEGSLPELLWEQLVQRDPAAAEERLRERLNSGTADEGSSVRLRMVHALRNQGRAEDARRELDAMLRDLPEDPQVIEALAAVDRTAALEHLRRRVTQSPSPGSWGLYGEQLLRGDRREEATAAFWQAWEMAPTDGYQYRLLELAPRRVASRLVEQAAASNDDELFGDIADALWSAGQRSDARRYWLRARDIDPTDSEWIGKLRALDEGRDPLQ